MIDTEKALLIKAELVYGVSIDELVRKIIYQEPLFSYSTKDMEEEVDRRLTRLYHSTSQDLEALGLGSLASVIRKVDKQTYIQYWKDIVWQLCDEMEDDMAHYLIDIRTKLMKQNHVPYNVLDSVCNEVRMQLEARLEDVAEKLNDAIVEELINA